MAPQIYIHKYMSPKEVIFDQKTRIRYFTLATIGFLISFLLLPSPKAVNNYYYIFLALPALIVFCCALSKGETFAFGTVEPILWSTLLFWCLIGGIRDDGVVYAKNVIYVALFLIVTGRLIDPIFLRSESFARSQFWLIVAYVLFSMLVNWINGTYTLDARLHPLPSRMRFSTYTGIWFNACFILAFPVWQRRRAWVEMFLAFILMVSLMVFVLQTRSGLIALIVASTFFTSADFFLSPRRVFFRLSVGAGVLFLVCALVLYLFPILLYLIQHPEIQYSEEWRQLPVLQQVVFRADAHRFELWGNFLKDWYTCGLWTGCGPAFETQRPLLDGFIPYAHNIYLAFGLHNGLPAIFLFLALCIFSLRTAWRKRDPWGAYLLVSLSGLFFEGNQIINSPNECWLLVLLPMALIAHPGFPGVRTRHFVDSKSENSNFQA